MENINVRFIHPTDHSDIEAELDDEVITAEKAINELIAHGFITEEKWPGYSLQIRDTCTEITGNQTLASGGAKDGCSIRIMHRTCGGA